jgi:hypothetical protein
MESKSVNLFDLWGKAQNIIRKMLRGGDEEVRIFDIVKLTDGEVRLKGRESIEALRKFKMELKKCLDLLEEVLDNRRKLTTRTSNKQIIGATMDEIESRFAYIDKLYKLCRETLKSIEPIIEGHLELILEPRLFKLLRELWRECTKGEPARPLQVSVTITYIL